MVNFSIHVPVYNAKEYLSRCLDSILNQTYSNFELLLTNDGSFDGSHEICEQYALMDERIRVFHQDNIGVFETRVNSVMRANGDYCIFVDADDYIERTMLERLAKSIEESHPDVICFDYFEVSGNCEIMKTVSNIQIVNKKSQYINEDLKYLYMLISTTDTFNAVWSKAYSTSILKEALSNCGSGYESFSMGEDAVIVCKALKLCETVYYLQIPLYYYCYNTDSISHNYDLKKHKDISLMLKEKEKFAIDVEIYQDPQFKQKWNAYFTQIAIVLCINASLMHSSYKQKREAIRIIRNDQLFDVVDWDDGRKQMPLRRRFFNLAFSHKCTDIVIALCCAFHFIKSHNFYY